MEATETAKAPFRRSDSFEIGQEDAAGIAHEDPLHVPLAVHEYADLPVDLPRDLRHRPSKLMGNDGPGRDTSLIKLLEALSLERLEAVGVAGEFMDSSFTSVLLPAL